MSAPRYALAVDTGSSPILDSIDITNVWGLSNCDLMGVLVFSCARVSAVVGMKLEDYFVNPVTTAIHVSIRWP